MKIQSRANTLESNQIGKSLNSEILFVLGVIGFAMLLVATPALSDTGDPDLSGQTEIEPDIGYEAALDYSNPKKSTNIIWEITKRPVALAATPVWLIYKTAQKPERFAYLGLALITMPVTAIVEPDLILYDW